MEEILYNLALVDCIHFCQENEIDCSGSHLEKYGRGYNYALIRDEDKKVLVIVKFTKNRVPEHFVPTEMHIEVSNA